LERGAINIIFGKKDNIIGNIMRVRGNKGIIGMIEGRDM